MQQKLHQPPHNLLDPGPQLSAGPSQGVPEKAALSHHLHQGGGTL